MANNVYSLKKNGNIGNVSFLFVNYIVMNKTPIDLIIYDWDGTLMDSVSVITECIKIAFDEQGIILSDAEASYIIGMGLVEAIEYLAKPYIDHLHYDEKEAFVEVILDHYKKHFKARADVGLQPFPGVAEALRDLKTRGVRLAVATGKSRAGLERDFNHSGLGDYFMITRTIDDAPPKPNPQMIRDILSELDVESENALMVGDTSFDLEMAQKARVRSVASTYGAHTAASLAKYAPLAMFGDFQSLHGWIVDQL